MAGGAQRRLHHSQVLRSPLSSLLLPSPPSPRVLSASLCLPFSCASSASHCSLARGAWGVWR
eukprot:3012915-Rhodomonas_salina.1